jgi:hypothetical protein
MNSRSSPPLSGSAITPPGIARSTATSRATTAFLQSPRKFGQTFEQVVCRTSRLLPNFYFRFSTFLLVGTGGEVGDWSDPAQFLVH